MSPTQHPASTRSGSMSEEVRGNSSHDLPEWPEELKENLVNESVQNTETLPVLLMNYLQNREQKWYRVSTAFYFPKDRNCNICLRTKITRASCRKRTGTVVPRAESSGDLITADDKFLSEGCESRNNPRHAVVVQDLATRWIQSYPCEKKLLRKRKRACKSSWSRRGNQKSFTLTIPWNSAKLVKISPGIIARLHHTDRRLWYCGKSSAQSERRYVCSTVAIRSE